MNLAVFKLISQNPELLIKHCRGNNPLNFACRRLIFKIKRSKRFTVKKHVAIN